MTLATRRLTVKLRPHVGFAGAGLLAVLAGGPVLAQVINGPAAAPNESPLTAPAEPSPSATPPAAAPEQPASPFGPAPGVFPTILPAPSPGQPASPLEPAPGVFPDLSPAPSTSAAPTEPVSPLEPAPGVFPGVSGAPATPATPTLPATASGSTPAIFPGLLPTPGSTAPPLLAPQYGFGFPSAAIAVQTAGVPTLPAVAPTSVGLEPLRPGALPVQLGDNRAPPILIMPTVTLFEGYSDNPRNQPNTLSDSVTHVSGGTTVSVDSVRLQGQLTGTLDYHKYARATDQDTFNANFLGYGLGTIVQDHVFIDGRATITQLSRTGGVGFADSTLIPPSQQTQAEIISVSPIVRESLGGYVDGEFRYNYAMSMFHNGSLLNNSTAIVPLATAPSTSLSDTTTNDATLSLATGRRFTFFGSKLTLDANHIDSQSAARSTQLRGYDDLEYQFSQQFAALARVGYENLRYPLQPAATTTGPVWQIGGRFTPFTDSYLIVHYGLQDGFYGADGALRYQVTPATAILASVQNNLSSSQQEILTNLNTSQVDAYGNVVNQIGLPSALANPEFSYASNNIFHQKEMRAGVQTTVGRNTFGLIGFFDRRAALGTPTGGAGATAASSGSSTALGANFNWSRSLTPTLTSSAALGYATQNTNDQTTVTADLRLTYTLNERLNAVVHYQFINVDSATVAGVNGSYRRNQLEIGVTRRF